MYFNEIRFGKKFYLGNTYHGYYLVRAWKDIRMKFKCMFCFFPFELYK